MSRLTRQILLAALLIASAGLGLISGTAAGTAAVPHLNGAAYVPISVVNGKEISPRDITATGIILRQDGSIIRLEQAGYTVRTSSGSEAVSLLAAAARDESSWQDSYLVDPANLSQRIELRLYNSGSVRAITVDNPLQNTALPDSLYSFLSVLVRVNGPTSSASVPVSAVRIHALAMTAPAGTVLESVPAGLDLAAAEQGLTVSGADLAKLKAGWPELTYTGAPGNASRWVKGPSGDLLIYWTPLFDGWAASQI